MVTSPRDDAAYWVDRLDFQGRLLVLDAFFDDTIGRKENRPWLHATVGVLFDSDGAKRFADGWAEICPPLTKPFHATACANGHGQFSGWGKVRCNALLSDLSDLVAKTRGPAAVISHVTDENFAIFKEHNRPLSDSVPNPFTLCLFDAISALTGWMAEKGIDDDIAYVFEAGSPGEADAAAFMRRAYASAEQRERLRIASYIFAPKARAAALIAADYIAWECQRSAVRDEAWPERFQRLVDGSKDKPVLTSAINPEMAVLWGAYNRINGLDEDGG